MKFSAPALFRQAYRHKEDFFLFSLETSETVALSRDKQINLLIKDGSLDGFTATMAAFRAKWVSWKGNQETLHANEIV